MLLLYLPVFMLIYEIKVESFETIWTDFISCLFGTEPLFKARIDQEPAWYGSLWVSRQVILPR